MSAFQLDNLALSAQRRNRREGITGMVVYDDGHFFQWLEGPADSVGRVWHSVSQDVRHTDIEVLGKASTQKRAFADWDMKLCSRPERAAHPATNVVPIATRAALLSVVGSALIPALVAKHFVVQPLHPDVDPRAAELARLLLVADPDAAHDLVAQILASGSFAVARTNLFEPAARRLGDLWQTDDCCELDVTLGLCRLQTSIRRLTALVPRHPVVNPLAVLIAPQPGEIHLLAAALEAETMWRSGWDVQAEFPATDDALSALVSGTWFDSLSLSLSPAFRREHWLPRMTETIALARVASRNPGLVVLVGGRVFLESSAARRRVGADQAETTVAEALVQKS